MSPVVQSASSVPRYLPKAASDWAIVNVAHGQLLGVSCVSDGAGGYCERGYVLRGRWDSAVTAARSMSASRLTGDGQRGVVRGSWCDRVSVVALAAALICIVFAVSPAVASANWEPTIVVGGPAVRQLIFDSRDVPWATFVPENAPQFEPGLGPGQVDVARLTRRDRFAGVRAIPGRRGASEEVPELALNNANDGALLVEYMYPISGLEHWRKCAGQHGCRCPMASGRPGREAGGDRLSDAEVRRPAEGSRQRERCGCRARRRGLWRSRRFGPDNQVGESRERKAPRDPKVVRRADVGTPS